MQSTTQKAVRVGAIGLSAASVVAAVAFLVSPADPRTYPLADLSGVTAAGSFTFDWSDGAGGDISYGGSALGVSEDGRYLYIACNGAVNQKGIAKLLIPALGGRATVAAPCLGPNRAEIEKLVPGWGAGNPLLGGVLEQGGRVVVAGYGSYDANNQAVASHWAGPSLTALAGPYGALLANAGPAGASTRASGLVKDYMGPIPQDWRALLGGPAFSMAGYTSIISRASYGASFSVFDPATVTASGFPMTMLLGCPHSVAACQTYGTPTSNNYNGSELSGGGFIVPGTRTFVAIEREASGPTCYGWATTDPTLQGQKHPAWTVDSPSFWCYSLTDPPSDKGPKGYPYRLVAKLYDLNDLVAVKAGTKKPWDVKQYATVDLPGSSAGEFVSSGAFNPVTGDYYLLRNQGGGVNRVYVYRGFAAGGAAPPPPPPAPVDCVPGVESMVGDDSATAACVGGLKHVTETWTRTGDVPASNGGAACVPVVSPRFRDDPCSLPPVDPCVAAPVVLSVTAWPGAGEGARSGSWSWSVVGSVETLIKAEWAFTSGRAVSLAVMDSRGCSARVVRP